MKICSIAGCKSLAKSRGFCTKHYMRLRNFGDVNARRSDWGQRERHPLYRTWCGMRLRCSSSKHKDFHLYGARGIYVCDRWQDFWAFVEDMGPKPSAKHTVGRINNDGPYSPENCRWETWTQQANNRRHKIAAICKYDRCESVVESKGYCHRHSRWFTESKTYEDRKDRKCQMCGCDLPDHLPILTMYCSVSCRMKWHRRYGCYAKNAAEPKKVCSIDGCERVHQAKGYCRAHYMQMWRGQM